MLFLKINCFLLFYLMICFKKLVLANDCTVYNDLCVLSNNQGYWIFEFFFFYLFYYRKRLNNSPTFFHAYTSLMYDVHAWKKNVRLLLNRLRNGLIKFWFFLKVKRVIHPFIIHLFAILKKLLPVNFYSNGIKMLMRVLTFLLLYTILTKTDGSVLFYKILTHFKLVY